MTCAGKNRKYVVLVLLLLQETVGALARGSLSSKLPAELAG